MGKLKMNLYITRKYDGSNNAGGKAPSDINTICKELGWQEYRMVFPNKDDSKIDKLCGLLLSCPKQWLKMGRKKKTVHSVSASNVFWNKDGCFLHSVYSKIASF